jgi:hypothetical protein
MRLVYQRGKARQGRRGDKEKGRQGDEEMKE